MSSLLEPDFSLTPSETVESATTADHAKKRSPIWAHTCRPIENENQAFLYCSYCKLDSIVLLYSTTSTRNITKYIKRHHKEITLNKALSKN